MAKNTATPTTTHRQKLLGLFPDWRLKNAVKNASEEELETSADACEWWGWRGAILLIIGLIAEVVLAWWDPPHESIPGRWGNVFATLLVAIGVGIEVQFAKMASRRTGELTRRAKKQLGEALERAAKTERELIVLKTPRRNIFSEKTAAFSTLLSAFSGTVFDIGMGPNDGEVEDFIWDIEPALWAAGWTQIDWVYPPGTALVMTRNSGNGPPRFVLGTANVSNVMIELHPNPPSGLLAAANGLAAILKDIGIDAHVVGFNIHNVNPNAMHILIGPKR